MKTERYIYNLEQARYIANRGAMILEINTGGRGDIYVKFKFDEIFDMAFVEWKERNLKIKL